MKHMHVMLQAVLMLLFFSLYSFAGEDCAMLGGTCKDACGQNETAEAGAFSDCNEKQVCCVAQTVKETQCCVISFEQKDHGPHNCIAPEQGTCVKGSASTLPCAQLSFCKEQ